MSDDNLSIEVDVIATTFVYLSLELLFFSFLPALDVLLFG